MQIVGMDLGLRVEENMTRFFISDLHIGQNKIIEFLKNDGTRLRPFDSLDEMHQYMIEKWNGRVNKQDTVYVLGDVSWKNRGLSMMNEFNGRKILIRGNHDIEKPLNYLKYFADIRGCDVKPGYIATHLPIHPESVGRFGLNIHGHLHANKINDKRYFNVSCEQLDYTPITLEEILETISERQA